MGKDIESIVVNLSSYWARVSSSLGGDNDLYEVEDGLGEKHVVPHSSLRHHDWHTICCGHISDDKLHDRFAMQQFTYCELTYLEQYLSKEFPNDLIDGRIKRPHQHSDNASQHFKSTGSIEYFSSLVQG